MKNFGGYEILTIFIEDVDLMANNEKQFVSFHFKEQGVMFSPMSMSA